MRSQPSPEKPPDRWIRFVFPPGATPEEMEEAIRELAATYPPKTPATPPDEPNVDAG